MKEKPLEERTLLEIIQAIPSLKGRGVDSITLGELLKACDSSEDQEDQTLEPPTAGGEAEVKTAPFYRAPTPELIRFTQLLSILIEGGVPLVDCFTVLSVERPALGTLADLSAAIRERLQQGLPLNQAIAASDNGELDTLYRSVIKAGTVGGALDVALRKLELFLRADMAINQCRVARDLDAAACDRLRLVRVLGILSGLDVPIMEYLEIAEAVLELSRHRKALHDVRIQFSEGKSLSEAFAATKQFPRLMVFMTHLGEITNDLDETFTRIARYYESILNLD